MYKKGEIMEASNVLVTILFAPTTATILWFILSLIHFRLTGVPLV